VFLSIASQYYTLKSINSKKIFDKMKIKLYTSSIKCFNNYLFYIIMLRIRLSRIGKKNTPIYKIVVAEKQRPVKGKFVESVLSSIL